MKNNIIGREKEKAILKKAYASPDPEFIAVYGRRRVGKTHLIREYFGNSICFEITGKHKASLGEAFENFAYSLGRTMNISAPLQKPSSWAQAFQQLGQFLESGLSKKMRGKKSFFLMSCPG